MLCIFRLWISQSCTPVTDFFWCNIIHLFIAKMLNKRPAIVFSESACVFWQCLSWVLPAYLQRAQPYVNYKAVHHTRLCYTKDPLISKHGTWITSIFPSNLFTTQRGFSHMCATGKITGQSSNYDAFYHNYSSIYAGNICIFGCCHNLCQTITTGLLLNSVILIHNMFKKNIFDSHK